jgi:hypothetical protein
MAWRYTWWFEFIRVIGPGTNKSYKSGYGIMILEYQSAEADTILHGFVWYVGTINPFSEKVYTKIYCFGQKLNFYLPALLIGHGSAAPFIDQAGD